MSTENTPQKERFLQELEKASNLLAYKRPPSRSELMLREMAVNYFAAHSILPEHLREAAFQPMLC